MKPENCLLVDTSLDPEYNFWKSNLKLADFGLATEINSGMALREPTGTMEYAAPEVIDLVPGDSRMRSKGYGYAADVWSIGVVAYIVLVGDFPYKKPRPMPNLRPFLIRYSKPEWKKLKPDTQNFVKSIFQTDPDQRPTAAQLLAHPFIVGHAPRVWLNMRKFRAKTRALMLIVRLMVLCKGYGRAHIEAQAAQTPLNQIVNIWTAFRARSCFVTNQTCMVREGCDADSAEALFQGERWLVETGSIIDELDTRYNMDPVTKIVQPRIRFLLNADPSELSHRPLRTLKAGTEEHQRLSASKARALSRGAWCLIGVAGCRCVEGRLDVEGEQEAAAACQPAVRRHALRLCRQRLLHQM